MGRYRYLGLLGAFFCSSLASPEAHSASPAMTQAQPIRKSPTFWGSWKTEPWANWETTPLRTLRRVTRQSQSRVCARCGQSSVAAEERGRQLHVPEESLPHADALRSRISHVLEVREQIEGETGHHLIINVKGWNQDHARAGDGIVHASRLAAQTFLAKGEPEKAAGSLATASDAILKLRQGRNRDESMPSLIADAKQVSILAARLYRQLAEASGDSGKAKEWAALAAKYYRRANSANDARRPTGNGLLKLAQGVEKTFGVPPPPPR